MKYGEWWGMHNSQCTINLVDSGQGRMIPSESSEKFKLLFSGEVVGTSCGRIRRILQKTACGLCRA